MELQLPPDEERAGLDKLLELHPGEPLSRRAARRTIERLLEARRFSDVVVRAVPVPGGVRVVIELTAQRKVASVEVEGNRVLTREEVLDTARLKPGSDYYPERLRTAVAAVEAVYRQRGYDDARVTAEPFGREVEMGILLRVDEGVPTRVAEVSVAGSPGLPLPRVLETVGLQVGAVLDRRALDAGLEKLRALYRQERFYAARVGDPVVLKGPEGAQVALPLSAGPRYTFHFHGNRRFSDRMLFGALRYDGTEILDESTLGRLSRRLESFYHYHGFYEVKVAPQEIVRPDESRAILAFNLDEGPQLRVDRMEFQGNKELSSRELGEQVALQILQREPEEHGDVHRVGDPLELQGRSTAPAASEADEPEPEPGSVYIEDAYRDAAEAMAEMYRQRGFPQAEVRFADSSVDVEERKAQVRFEVHEGPRVAVRAISFEGAPVDFDAVSAADIASGAPLSDSAVQQSRVALLAALGRAGYPFARVTVDPLPTPDGARADLRYRIEAGPQVRMGRLIFQGLERTDEAMVLAGLKLRAGDVLDLQALAEVQRILVQLGIFRQVEVKLLEPERVEPVKDVVVTVKERPRLAGEVGGGYSLVDGPRLTGDAVLSNIGGQGVNLTGRGKINYVGASAQSIQTGSLQGLDALGLLGNVALQQPRMYGLFPGLEVGGRLDLIAERVIRQVASYRFDRFATVAGLDWAALSWLNTSLQYELEQVQVKLLSSQDREALLTSVTRADQERLRFPFGVFALQTLRSTLNIDLRDNPVNPRKGLLISTVAEVTGSLYTRLTEPDGSPLYYPSGQPQRLPIFTLKVSGNVSAYLPLAERVLLAISVRGGRILPLDPSEPNTIEPKRFFLGGSTTMRGFWEDAVIPQDRRDALHAEVAACQQLANPAGCSPSAQLLGKGLVLPSEGGTLFDLGKAELRFSLSQMFGLGLFFEAGNLWLSPVGANLLQLRYVAGTGIRYATPIGPLALDVGFNLFPDPALNEPLFNVSFSIGIF